MKLEQLRHFGQWRLSGLLYKLWNLLESPQTARNIKKKYKLSNYTVNDHILQNSPDKTAKSYVS